MPYKPKPYSLIPRTVSSIYSPAAVLRQKTTAQLVGGASGSGIFMPLTDYVNTLGCGLISNGRNVSAYIMIMDLR